MSINPFSQLTLPFHKSRFRLLRPEADAWTSEKTDFTACREYQDLPNIVQRNGSYKNALLGNNLNKILILAAECEPPFQSIEKQGRPLEGIGAGFDALEPT